MTHFNHHSRLGRKQAMVSTEQIVDALARSEFTLDNPGFCLACGAEADGCDPDARGYECEACGERQVYGAQELLLRVA